jgi:hypothetical protein
MIYNFQSRFIELDDCVVSNLSVAVAGVHHFLVYFDVPSLGINWRSTVQSNGHEKRYVMPMYWKLFNNSGWRQLRTRYFQSAVSRQSIC